MKSKYLLHLLVGAIVIGVGVVTGISSVANRETVRPRNATQFAQTSVMIMMADQRGGGSGVIYKSSDQGTIILTNKHVCEIIQTGGTANTRNGIYKIRSYKFYTKHDLCMVKINENLHTNTIVAQKNPPTYSHAWVSGHPNLQPHTLTQGFFSTRKKLEIAVGFKACDGTETNEDAFYCFFYKVKPILKTYESQYVTATIMAGSSGSGVFDENGEIAGLVFAGSPQGLSYAYIVPHEFVKDFTDNEAQYQWRKTFKDSKVKFFGLYLKQRCKFNPIFADVCNGR